MIIDSEMFCIQPRRGVMGFSLCHPYGIIMHVSSIAKILTSFRDFLFFTNYHITQPQRF
jgi:hypothetical protein